MCKTSGAKMEPNELLDKMAGRGRDALDNQVTSNAMINAQFVTLQGSAGNDVASTAISTQMPEPSTGQDMTASADSTFSLPEFGLS